MKKKGIRRKRTSTKIEVTKRSADSDDDFDTHVFMVHGDDDDVIMDDRFPIIDLHWNQASSPALTYDWQMPPSNDISVYFPYSSGPSSPSTVILDEHVQWRIKYDLM